MQTQNTHIKNIAIVAHVDHGKTTLVDGLLKQSGTLKKSGDLGERIMDSGDLEKERGITITAKNCAFAWKGVKINLLDTPGHADFGGEVERSLMMVDSILLLVDASEGPLPQTRFVLSKAIQQKLKIAVVINKVDRPDQRIDEVKVEVEDLLLEMADMLNDGETEFDVDIPFFYASAKEGWASDKAGDRKENLHTLLDFMVSDFFPSPRITAGPAAQFLVANLSYSPYLGALMIGRLQRGVLRKMESFTWCGANEARKNFRLTSLQTYEGLIMVEVQQAQAGEIVILAGMEEPQIGDSVCAVDTIEPLPRIFIEPPTVSVDVSVSTSPFSGKDGEYLTSRKLDDFLQDACRNNVALKYAPSEDPKVFVLKGRGELQLAIVFEQLRRKGFEFMVGRPQVIMQKSEDGQTLEPYEKVVIDLPSQFTGTLTELMAKRKGILENLIPMGVNRSRMEFIVPSRGLIGLRSIFLTETKGEGLMSSEFVGHKVYAGQMLSRTNGAIIADRTGKATPYALFNLLSSGRQFVKPGEQVYEGMVIGEHTRTNDLNVNVCREKHLSGVRTAGKDENVILPPVPERTMDFALGWIESDEWVEVTPLAIRIRKKMLAQNQRSVIRK